MQTLIVLCALCAAPPARGPVIKVTVDVSKAPQVEEWGKKAAALAVKWHPIITDLLRSDGHVPPTEVRIVFEKDMKVPAYASGRTITISAKWVTDHPGDFGMVVHELTHVIQGYRRGGPGWLVEGIADYVRFFHFEPKVKINVNPKKAKYTDSYRTSAKFLAWVEANHDKELVRKLNEALRAGKYKDEMFETRTGKNLDRLWADFLAAQERK